MSSKKLVLAWVTVWCVSSQGIAGMIGDTAAERQTFRPLVAAFGGYASLNAADSQTFMGNNGELFIYENLSSGKNTGFVGGFLGLEHSLPWVGQWSDYFVQFGVEYDYVGSISESGLNNVGFAPDSFTLYTYNYNLQTQQVLGVAKGIGTYREFYHPYASVGLGAALNQLIGYNVTTTDTGELNATPLFDALTICRFSYALAIGVETDVSQQVRLGIGYRYANFGQAQFNYPDSFNLGATHAYANQFVAQITYKPIL